jgi:L-fucose isomerase-like protein
MKRDKTTFALFFGNRGFFPASLQGAARKEMRAALKKLGHKTIVLDSKATRYGAVETPAEGDVYAQFLAENRGKFGGVILCLPNFGDETGAIAALKEAGVPILVQAYPDDLDKMAPAARRDAFCGKFSIMDVFVQHGVPFTALPPHTVHPTSAAFAENIAYFDSLCRVVNGMKKMVVGAIGARTTAFKTVRIDELALERHGITVETLDLADIFDRVKKLKTSAQAYKSKARKLRGCANWPNVPKQALDNLVRLGVVLDQVVKEYRMDAAALRCWSEMQQQLGISPCVLLGEMGDRGIPVACEVDIGNAVTMYALSLASGGPATCLDWNNNYGEDENKCILFHCGPVPPSMMAGQGTITDHAILANVVGEGCSFGCNQGRIAPAAFTYGSLLTRDGDLSFYLGEGRFTVDPIPNEFFGCAGVAEIANLQKALQAIGYLGHRHHTSVTVGRYAEPVRDALARYLHFEVVGL